MISQETNKKVALFIQYMKYNDIGDWDGLRKNAPKIARDAYNEFMKEQKRAEKNGVRI